MPRGNRIRPTSFGIWFIVMTLVIGLAAVNTGNNLLILNFSLMLSTLLVSGIVSRAAMRRLTMTRRTPSTIYAGTPFTEAVTVSNRKRLYPSVSLRIRTAIATSSVHVSYVPPRGTRTFILEGLYPRRGRFKLEQLELSSLYPFGFFERHRLQMNDETVTVFPHVERILPFFPERRGGTGDNASLFKGEGEDLYQIREYTSGENSRLIDWKATSRVGKLMARDFHQNADLRITVIIDASAGKRLEVEALEREISLAASMIDYFHRHQWVYRLITTNGMVPFGDGPLQYRDALTHLAFLPVCEPSAGMSFCKKLAGLDTHNSIAIYFTVRGTALDLPVKAYRVLHAESHA